MYFTLEFIEFIIGLHNFGIILADVSETGLMKLIIIMIIGLCRLTFLEHEWFTGLFEYFQFPIK